MIVDNQHRTPMVKVRSSAGDHPGSCQHGFDAVINFVNTQSAEVLGCENSRLVESVQQSFGRRLR